MIYLSVQPDIEYFHWQVECYLHNFLKVGISQIQVIFLYDVEPSKEALQLKDRYNTVQFFFYKDERRDKSYIPSIKPWGLFRHLQEYPLLNKENPIFYHDSDILFREKIQEELFVGDDKWYLSDTISYIGYNYCVSKGVEQFKQMVDIVGLSDTVVKENESGSGGAQYIIKNTGWEFWYKVYDDSNKLYHLMDKLSANWKGPDYPIQKWCAEMWATLWNAWAFNYQTVVHKELDFCFATAPISDWDKYKILHNAGVTEVDKERMFFKGEFIFKNPLREEISYQYDNNYCSWKYFQNIQDLAKVLKNY